MLKEFCQKNKERYILIFMRISLGFAFLSAVADRFGLWGKAGDPNVGWGNFQAFEEYVLYLNPYLGDPFLTIASWGVTLLEISLGILLIIGIKIKRVSFVSAILLFSFGLAMALVEGIKSPFNYSVFTASASAFLLYMYTSKNSQTKAE
jgi:uncharacterized membrane protein YphA (DoxX/SURF4 family)